MISHLLSRPAEEQTLDHYELFALRGHAWSHTDCPPENECKNHHHDCDSKTERCEDKEEVRIAFTKVVHKLKSSASCLVDKNCVTLVVIFFQLFQHNNPPPQEFDPLPTQRVPLLYYLVGNLKIWRRRKFCQIRVFSVIYESSENRFGQPK